MNSEEYLFHYTDAEGFFGILDTRALWATHVCFMNDQRELLLGVETAMQLLSDAAEQVQDSEQARRWLWLRSQVSVIGIRSGRGAYASSFSTDGDSLSQWRAYCPRGGYAIGFPKRLLQQIAEQHQFSLDECVYDTAEHERLVVDAIRDVADGWVRSGSDEPWDRQEGERFLVASKLNWELYRLAPRLKHQGFAEEREWRLLSTPEYKQASERFRGRSGAIVPYVELPLGHSNDLWRSMRAVAGPSPSADLARAGAERLARHKTGYALTVESSSVPYRYW